MIDLILAYSSIIANSTWVLPSVRGDAPEPREGHSAALIGKRLFIFGGCGKFENSENYYDDLYILDTGMNLLLSLPKLILSQGQFIFVLLFYFIFFPVCCNLSSTFDTLS